MDARGKGATLLADMKQEKSGTRPETENVYNVLTQ